MDSNWNEQLVGKLTNLNNTRGSIEVTCLCLGFTLVIQVIILYINSFV
jgi:hypothetical protein